MAQTNAQTSGALHFNSTINGTSINGTSVAVANTNHSFEITAMCRVSVGGTITLQFRSEVSGSNVNIRPGSGIFVEQLAIG